MYLKITKLDTETGKPVLLPNTAFQIYWLDDNGNYRLENGKPKLVTMTDTVNGHLTKNVDTFYTNKEGILTLPEKLPLGKYRIMETNGLTAATTMSISIFPRTASTRPPVMTMKTAWTRWSLMRTTGMRKRWAS